MFIGIAYDIKEDYRFEREGSHFDFSTLSEVSRVKEALEKCGHHVKLLGNFDRILNHIKQNQLSDIDVVFNMSEGIQSRSREGWVPSLLEMYRIPYTGTDAYGLNVCLNKQHTKIMARYLDIPTPDFCLIESENELTHPLSFHYPCIIKPNYEGSSSGIIRIDDYDSLRYHVRELLQIYRQPVLCEQYIDGREFTVSLVGTGSETEPIGIIETVRKDGSPIGIFSGLDKLQGLCERRLPMDLSESIKSVAISQAICLHKFIGCRELNRVDYRMDQKGNLYFLEINPLPGLTESSAFPICCQLHGLAFHEVIDKIVQQAHRRYSLGIEAQNTYS